MEYGEALRKRRLELQITQEQLAKAIGSDHRRISDYETQRRIPDLATRKALDVALGSRVKSEPVSGSRKAVSLCPRRVYARGGKHSTSSRIKAARWRAPKLVDSLLRQIPSEVLAQLESYPCTSCWEALVTLFVVALRAELAWVRPLDARFFQHVVLHPVDELPAGHLRFPALLLTWKGQRIVFLPQVPVRTQDCPFCLDFLVGVTRRRQPFWIDLEVDGEGHDDSNDFFRTKSLSMPTLRYKHTQLLADGFLPRMLDDILAMVPVVQSPRDALRPGRPGTPPQVHGISA